MNCFGKTQNSSNCPKKNDDDRPIELEDTNSFESIKSTVKLEKICQIVTTKMTLSRQSKKWVLIGAVILGLCYFMLRSSSKELNEIKSNQETINNNESGNKIIASRKTVNQAPDGKVYEYDRNSPIIFIGGVPRSGKFSKLSRN